MLSVSRTRTSFLSRFLVAASALWLAACQPTAQSGRAPALDAGAPVEVALLVPSGGGSSALEARQMEQAARLAIADLQGVRVDLRVYPTGGSPSGASAAASRAVSDGAKIILGPLRGEEANAAGVAVAGTGVNVLSLSNNPSIAGGNVFILGTTFDNVADRLARYAVRQGKRRIMVIHDQGPAGEAGRAAIASAVPRAGGSIVGTATYQFSQAGIVSAVPGIVLQARGASADAVFLTADGAGALPVLSQLLSEAGLPTASAQYIGLSRWDIPNGMLSLPGLQGGWFALPDRRTAAQFNARYSAAYGEAPLPFAALAYDGIAAIGALARTGERNALSAASLTRGSGFAGASGIFRLQRNGTAERGLDVATIRNNQVVVIDPAPRSFGGPGL